MEEKEWKRIFQIKAEELYEGDNWDLEFDESIEPECPDLDWKEFIWHTSARFQCRSCSRQWPVNWVKVVFHMQLSYDEGTVKVRRFRQNCKNCNKVPMEEPNIEPKNISILLENLVLSIRKKYYDECWDEEYKPTRKLEVRSSHEPDHCEACIKRICRLTNC
ncbi:receptor-transporting protein 3-like [Symphorus nematophorus]